MHTQISKTLSYPIVLNQMRQKPAILRRLALFGAMLCAVTLLLCPPLVHAQLSPVDETTAAMRDRIHSAQQSHASQEELGRLWLALGNQSEDRFIYTEAEDAFARALRLLAGKDQARGAYADALAGMGRLYISTGRYSDSEAFLYRSTQIYESLGDRDNAATAHASLALAMMFQRKYRETEAESLLARTEFASLSNPNPAELTAAAVTHAYALYFLGHSTSASTEIDQAIATARARLQPNSPDLMAALLARAFIHSRIGDDWEPSITEALRIARTQTVLPLPARHRAELIVMQQYQQLLEGAHRKSEAKAMEREIADLQEKHPAGCTNCTVSAAAFSPAALLH